MAKYRKKPVVIDATQWHGWENGPDGLDIVVPYHLPNRTPEQGWIATLEGGHIVTPGDYIITGIQGEKYPCKPDIFAATYEPAE